MGQGRSLDLDAEQLSMSPAGGTGSQPGQEGHPEVGGLVVGRRQSCCSLKLGRLGCERRALPLVPKGRMMDSLRSLRATTWSPRGQEPSLTLPTKGFPDQDTHRHTQAKVGPVLQQKHFSLWPHSLQPGLPECGSRLLQSQGRGLQGRRPKSPKSSTIWRVCILSVTGSKLQNGLSPSLKALPCLSTLSGALLPPSGNSRGWGPRCPSLASVFPTVPHPPPRISPTHHSCVSHSSSTSVSVLLPPLCSPCLSCHPTPCLWIQA